MCEGKGGVWGERGLGLNKGCKAERRRPVYWAHLPLATSLPQGTGKRLPHPARPVGSFQPEKEEPQHTCSDLSHTATASFFSSLRFPEPQGVISLFGLKASMLLRNNAANREHTASLRGVLGSGSAHTVPCSSQGRCLVLNPSKSSDLRLWSLIFTNGDSKIPYS